MFVLGNSTHKTFLEMLQAEMQNINPSDYSIILVAGGYNDINYEQSVIRNNINDFMQYVQNNFPHAKKFIAMIANSSDQSNNVRYLLSSTVYYAYADKYPHPFIYLTGSETILKNYYLMSEDKIHPNANGYLTLARQLYQGILGGHCSNVEFRKKAVITPYNGYSAYCSNGNIDLIYNMSIINLGILEISKNEGSFIVNNGIELAIVNLHVHQSVIESLVFQNVTCRFTKDDETTILGNGYLTIDDDNQMILHFWTSDGSTSIPNVKRIEILTSQITVPALYI